MPQQTVAELVRRYFEQGVGRRDLSVLEDILHPDYVFHGGGATVRGRDDNYIPMVKAYLDEQADVGTIVHEVIATHEYAAVHLTKTTSDPPAAWKTILVYRGVPGGQLTECWYEQDWASYRRQLRGHQPVPPVAPAVSRPWQITPADPSTTTENTARRWLEGASHDELLDLASPLAANSVSINCLLGVGDRFAFHVTQHGTYTGGIDGHDSRIGASVSLVVAGMGRVFDDQVVNAHAVADQDVVRRQLRMEAHR